MSGTVDGGIQESRAGDPETAVPAPRKPRSRVWPQVLLGIAILVCGVLIGAGGTLLVGRKVLLPGSRQPAQVGGAVAKQMSRRLNLTPQQERDVRRIVREHMERVNDIRNQGRQDIQAELDAMRDEVAQVLTPQQAQAWRRQFDRLRRLAPQPPHGRRDRGGP